MLYFFKVYLQKENLNKRTHKTKNMDNLENNEESRCNKRAKIIK